MARNWADLPEELLDQILSNLYAKDRHAFGMVCKSWNAVTLFSLYSYSPCLMFYKSCDRLWKFLQYNGLDSMEFPQLHGVEILCSKYGWLLLSLDDQSIFFFDPFNEQKIHNLPKSNHTYKRISFFNKPTSRDCIIIGISDTPEEGPAGVRVGVLNHGDDKWKSYLYYIEDGYDVSFSTPILHCQHLYVLDTAGNLSTFDMNGLSNQSSWNVNENCLNINCPCGCCTETEYQYLIQLLEGEQLVLLAVFVACHENKVNVYKMDMNRKCKEWESVEDLFDKAVFVSHTASFAATPPPPLKWMANKIFFPKLHNSRNGVFYSLVTKKYHSYEGDYSSSNSYGLKDMNFATWIMPEPTPKFPRDVTWSNFRD